MQFRLWFYCAIAGLGLVAGCQAPKTVDIGTALKHSLGAAVSIEFRADPGPIDADMGLEDTLTLADAIGATLKTHPRVQAAIYRVRAAQAEAHQASLLPNPVLSLVLRFPKSGGDPNIEAGLGADLVRALQTRGRVSAADRRLRAAAAEAMTTVLDLIAEVERTYGTVQALQASLPLLEARRELLGRLYNLAQDRLNAGEASRLEMVTVDAQRASVEAQVDDVLLDLRENQLALARLIGEPSIVGGLQVSAWKASPMNSVSEAAWTRAALQRRPEIARRTWELAALGVDLRLARFGIFDTLSVGALAVRDREFSSDPEWSGAGTLSTPLPLFDWGQATRARLTAQQIEAGHLLLDTQRQVIEDVRRACAAFNESVHELERSRTRLIPLQQERRDLAEAAFRSGHTDVTTLIMAEQDLGAARARGVELELRHAAARARLNRAVGGAGIADELIRSTPDATSQDTIEIKAPTRPSTRPTQSR